jgi:uncharacterized iron-regulated membrane protein
LRNRYQIEFINQFGFYQVTYSDHKLNWDEWKRPTVVTDQKNGKAIIKEIGGDFRAVMRFLIGRQKTLDNNLKKI